MESKKKEGFKPYVVFDQEDAIGVPDRPYKRADFNDLSKGMTENDDIIYLGVGGGTSIPNPLVNYIIQASDGSLSNPGYSWATDTDTGFYWLSSGVFAVSINGTKEVEFNSSGIAIPDMTQGSVLFAGASGQVTQDNSNLFFNNTDNRLGIGTASPTRTLQASKLGEPQLRLDATLGYYVDLQCDGNADLYVTNASGLGQQLVLQGGDAATDYRIRVNNTNTTSGTSGAVFYAQVASTNGGDPYMVLDIFGGTTWIIGADNSDSDKFKLTTSALSGFSGTKGIFVTSGIYTTFAPAVAASGTAYAVDISGAINTAGSNGLFRVLAAASTGQTASTEINFVSFDLGATTTWAAGTIANQRAIYIEAPTIAFNIASTVTNAATVYIDRAPQAGTNATITESWALLVDAGDVRLDGSLYVYNTYTDASNYERGVFRWSANTLQIGTEEAGTGSVRDVKFILYNGLTSARWYFGLSTHNLWSIGGDNIRPEATNTYDIGTSALKVHDLWLGSTLFLGSGTSNEANTLTVARLANNAYISGRNAADTDDIGVIGVNASDQIVLGAELQSSTSAVVPYTDNTIDLGTASLRWENGHFAAITTAALTNSGLTSGRVVIAGASGILTDDSGLTFVAADNALAIAGWLEVGTATDAAAAGDFVAGLTGASRMFWDQSGALLSLYNSTTATNLYAATGFLGVGISPTSTLHVLQSATSSGTAKALLVTAGAHTNWTTATGIADIDFAINRTVDRDAGAVSADRFVVIRQPTVAFDGASTVTTGSTVSIIGAPIAGTNATITNSYGLLVESGRIGALNSASGADSVAYVLFNNLFSGSLPAYGIGMGPTSTEGYMLFRAGSASTADHGFKWQINNSQSMRLSGQGLLATYDSSAVLNNQISSVAATGTVFNENQADIDFRIEGDSITYMFFTDATATTENIAILAAAAPNWQTMDRGVFVGDTTNAPTGNPASGGFLYSNAGAGTWRGSGGTVTAFGPAGPHCGACGYDMWTVAARNDKWQAWCYECGHCGKVYKGGPQEVLDLLDNQQKSELLRDGMTWDDLVAVMG